MRPLHGLNIGKDKTMARINKAQAKRLAVAYSSYNQAVSKGNQNSIDVWGMMLIDAQKKTGIELLSEDTIKRLMD